MEASDAESGTATEAGAEAPLVAAPSGGVSQSAKLRLCLGAMCGLVLLGGLATRKASVYNRPAVGKGSDKLVSLEGDDGDEAPEEKPPCAGEGGACTDAKCCLDGGEGGLQCWEKGEFYAVCLSNKTCEPGVHEGETEGEYDEYGTFHLSEWSCKKLGERSLPGCESYGSAKECPSGRCMWMNETGACLAECSVFPSKEACPDSHCMWDGAACVLDPCSAPGEDCSKSKCCSQARWAEGMQCFQKDSTWSTCMPSCNKDGDQAGWSCKELGERTNISKTCSFSGESCSDTHLCCNTGHECVVKDENFAGCLQTSSKTTWTSQQIPIPEDWDGTVLGGNRGEYQASPAGEGEEMAGTSMFCFMAIIPDSEETKLMEVAKKFGSGVFGCNESSVYDAWQSNSAGWDTGEATLVNTDVFVSVWQQVQKEGKFLRHDWTVKTDADCAFFPDRLRNHLYQLRPAKDAMLYIKNTDQDAAMSNNQFLGAVEIFSRKAVQAYFDNGAGCVDTIGLNSGEDGFMKGCMDAVGAGFLHDGEILKPDGASSYCSTESKVAFHPLKCEATLENCYNIVFGNEPNWGANTCQDR